MRITQPEPRPRDTGDYHVYVSAVAYGKPYAKIYLDEGNDLALADITLDDARRLAKAAARIEQELAAAEARMKAPHGREHFYQGTCQLCGKPEDDELHDEPECPSVAPESGRRCTEAGEHDRHRNGLIVWGPGVTEPAPNAPHHVTPTGEMPCEARDGGYFCNSQEGHDGPEHVAYGPGSEVCHRWPVAATEILKAAS